ncbi:MAG: SDR family oxidoreductase [Rhizobacter sp.]|nr:SDR family oxidoreductase [Chlorobiales bacterium]
MAKTVLITGASSGIGKAAAKYFQAKSWNVAAAMRSPEKETELTSLSGVKCFKLDVLDDASISTAIREAVSHFGGLDIVVNNAGYGAVGAFEAATKAQVERQFGTNVFGVMNVVREVLPFFREKKSGIIINITSMGGRLTFPLYSLYHATKWAVEGFTESLRYELTPLGIKVKLIEPGAIKTDFYERSQDLFKKDGLTAYDDYQTLTMPNMQAAGANAPGPEIVAEMIYTAATDGSDRLRYAVGSNAPALIFLRRILPESWFTGIVKSQVEKQ